MAMFQSEEVILWNIHAKLWGEYMDTERQLLRWAMAYASKKAEIKQRIEADRDYEPSKEELEMQRKHKQAAEACGCKLNELQKQIDEVDRRMKRSALRKKIKHDQEKRHKKSRR